MKKTLTIKKGLKTPIKILYTSDVHTSSSHFAEFLNLADKKDYDYLIVNGDITPKVIFMRHNNLNVILRKQEEYLKGEFTNLLKDFRSKNPNTEVFVDLGNDDFKFNRYFLQIQEGYLLHLLHMKTYELSTEVSLIGYMCVPPTPFGIKDWEKPEKTGDFPFGSRLDGVISVNGAIRENYVMNIHTEDTIENDLKILSENITKPFIFASHAPPFGTPLDMISNTLHVGSKPIRDFVDSNAINGNLVCSLHGHIHESPDISGSIVYKTNGISCINIGQTNRDFHYLVLTII